MTTSHESYGCKMRLLKALGSKLLMSVLINTSAIVAHDSQQVGEEVIETVILIWIEEKSDDLNIKYLITRSIELLE